MKPKTVTTLRAMKSAHEKIASLTAYDYSFAALADRAGVDLVMVGDSLGMVMQGHATTIPVTIEHMAYHAACVSRGVSNALVVVDMPFMSYQRSREQALDNAALLMRDGGAQMVKLEGGEAMAETVRFLTERGMPVCAHIGLTPQSVHQLGGYGIQGRDAEGAQRLINDAHALETAGAAMIVLEAIPADLAARITQSVAMPTIGIGAGRACDGQVLVLQDMLGIYPRPSPKFSRNFMEGAAGIEAAVRAYVAAVKSGAFPDAAHTVA